MIGSSNSKRFTWTHNMLKHNAYLFVQQTINNWKPNRSSSCETTFSLLQKLYYREYGGTELTTNASTSSTNNRSGKYLHALKTNFYFFFSAVPYILSNDAQKMENKKIETQRKWLTASLCRVAIIVCNHVCVRETHFTLETSTQSAFSNPRLQTLFRFRCMHVSFDVRLSEKITDCDWLKKSVPWNNQSSFQESLDFVKPLNYYSNFLLNSPFFARCCSKSANRFEEHPKIGLNLNTECICLDKKRSSWNIHIQIHVI